jgi:hypothetical protein
LAAEPAQVFQEQLQENSNMASLLEHLTPQRCLEPWHHAADEAIRSFAVDHTTVSGHMGAIDRLTRFYPHVLAALLNIQGPISFEGRHIWGLCLQVLHKLYGPEGDKAACERVCHGVEGGWRQVAHDFAHQMADDIAEEQLRMAVRGFWQTLSPAERWEATEEFIQKCGNLFPRELTAGSAARLHAYLPDFLEKIPQELEKLSRLSVPQ